MANLFQNKGNMTAQPSIGKGLLAVKYNKGVANLLIVVIFTLINIVLLVTQANRYFLFSACVPYLLADLGMYLTGMYPEEAYYEAGSAVFYDKSFFAIMMVIAGVIMLLYFLCWLFARKQKVGWLIFATVLFALDTVILFLLSESIAAILLDAVFHIWALVSMGIGISAYFKMRKLPNEEIIVQAEAMPEEPEPAGIEEPITEA